MTRYEIRAHIYDVIKCAVALEVDAETEELARINALTRLRAQYPESHITLVAKEV